jgi:hypothetical protein
MTNLMTRLAVLDAVFWPGMLAVMLLSTGGRHGLSLPVLLMLLGWWGARRVRRALGPGPYRFTAAKVAVAALIAGGIWLSMPAGS